MQVLRTCLVAIAVMLAAPVFAQLAPAPTPSPTAASDPYRRTTPRSSVTELIGALAAKDYKRAAHFLDLPIDSDPRVANGAAELARRLQNALDSGGTLQPFPVLSNEPGGRIDDDLAEDREQVGTLGPASDNAPITLARSADGDGQQVWRISHATIRLLMKRPTVVEPETAPSGSIVRTNVAGAPIEDWGLLIGVALISFFVLRAIAGTILVAARRLIADHEHSSVYGFMVAALPPLSLYLSVVGFYLYANSMPVAIVARQTLLRYAAVVAWGALAWFLFRLIDSIAKLGAGRMRRAERRQAVSVITLVRRSAKTVLIAVAVIAILDTIGLDVTTGIAALGIGGIALALGAQKTVENLVGSVTVIVDQPVQVGDFCKVGDVLGTVEDIGMRSTRIRTNARTVVTIPNGNFAALQIENFSKRDRFLFNPTIGVEYGVDSAMLARGISIIEEILAEHDRVVTDGARAKLVGFGDNALLIEVFAYIATADFAASLGVQQELLLAILDRLQGAGLGIAFPTRTVIVKPAGPVARPNAAPSPEK